MSEIADGLLVTGMHRSGTSAVAGALAHLGVDFGGPLMPPREGENSRGYFEHLEFFDFHQRFFARCAFAWDDPRRLDFAALPPALVDEAAGELVELLRKHFAGAVTWAVKDPRLCRLLPLWHRALDELDAEARHVLVVRHPDEVAASLAVRDGFSRQKSDLLWAEHLLEAERETRGRRRAFVSYRGVLESPAESFDALAVELDLAWPRRGPRAAAAVRDFLDGGLRHHRAAEGDREIASRGRLGDLSGRLYQQLTASEPSDATSIDHELLDELAGRLEERRGDLQPLLVEHMTQLALRGEATVAKDLDELEEQSLPWLERQRRDIEELRDLVHDLEDQLAERTRWLQIQDRILHEQVARLDRLESDES